MAEETTAPKRPAKKKTGKPSTGLADIGKRVRDRVTGVEGIAFQYHLLLNGTEQLGIQPGSEDGRGIPDGKFIDVQTVEVLDEGIKATLAPPETPRFKLGDEVRDVISGASGVITAQTVFINGCVYLTVQSKLNRKGEVPEHYFHQDRWALVTSGKVKARQPIGAAKDVSGSGPGGPMRPLLRAN